MSVVLKKSLALRYVGLDSIELTISLSLTVQEVDEPYALHFHLQSDDAEGSMFAHRMVDAAAIASELRHWLHGKAVPHPCIALKPAVDKAMTKYVRFGLPPAQKELISWMLSRMQLVAGEDDKWDLSFGEEEHGDDCEGTGGMSRVNAMTWADNLTPRDLLQEAPTLRRQATLQSYTDSVLGRSQSLDTLQMKTVAGRPFAAAVFSKEGWDSDTHRLVNHISTSRRDIQRSLEEKSWVSERERQIQRQKIGGIRRARDGSSTARKAGNWAKSASNEVERLQQIEAGLREEMLRTRCRSARETERSVAFVAPNGMNLRGRSKPGAFIGSGPVLTRPAPPASPSPRYSWDAAGRRSARDPSPATDEPSGMSDSARTIVNRAIVNCSLYKLSLKEVFLSADTAENGFLSPLELARAFISMGVHLTVDEMARIFTHFDPSGSETIRYDAFMLAFFNPKSFALKWSRCLSKLSSQDIMVKLILADSKGTGRLDVGMVRQLFNYFHLSMDDDILPCFVRSLGGGIDVVEMMELLAFIEKEQILMGDAPGGYMQLYKQASQNRLESRARLLAQRPPTYGPSTPRGRKNLARQKQGESLPEEF